MNPEPPIAPPASASDREPCSCRTYCRGASGLAARFFCLQEHPIDYRAAMKLPEGRTCDDCIHARRCFAMGYSEPGRTNCDFYPSKFILKAKEAAHV